MNRMWGFLFVKVKVHLDIPSGHGKGVKISKFMRNAKFAICELFQERGCIFSLQPKFNIVTKIYSIVCHIARDNALYVKKKSRRRMTAVGYRVLH